jgi:CheY-like chemotaxis protein
MLRALVVERIELVVETDGEVPPVLFDRGRLEQVIVNLVVNARDAIDGVGRIVIETGVRELDGEYLSGHADAHSGAHVMIAVSDSGAGMDEATQARIFEPFFTTKPVGSGTGLGLSTVHGIVKQSGGNIWVYSEPGHGTTFRIYLPVASAEAVAAHPPEDVPAVEPPAMGNGTILLVEDHEAVRVLTQRVLREAGYTVLATGSFEEAAAVLARSEVELVLTDLVMPGGTGEQIAERADARGVQPPILFMSGYTEAAVSRDDLLANGAGFLEKPFTPSRLLSAVADVLKD